MTSKKKIVTKPKTAKPTPRPEPIPADGTPLAQTSARFKKLIAGTAKEPVATPAPITPEPPPERPARRAKATTVAPAAAPVAPVEVTTPTPTGARKAPWETLTYTAPTEVITVADLAEAYAAAMLGSGKMTASTVWSYHLDLRRAAVFFGETALRQIEPTTVTHFFESVATNASGKPAAKPTVEKVRRSLRQALAWAVEAGHLDRAPLPAKAG